MKKTILAGTAAVMIGTLALCTAAHGNGDAGEKPGTASAAEELLDGNAEITGSELHR